MAKKLWAIPVGCLLCMGGMLLMGHASDQWLQDRALLPMLRERVMEGKRATLQTMVEGQAAGLAIRLQGVTDRAEQRRIISEWTDAVRFFPDQSGYLFAYDTQSVCVNVPVNKGRTGKDFSNEKDADGVLFINELVKAGQAGGGFVNYRFEKPGAGVLPKLSYARQIAGTDIVLGTGVYIDDVEREITVAQAALATTQAHNRRLNALVGLGLILPLLIFLALLIPDIVNGLRRMTAMLEDIAAGEGDLTRRLDVKRQDELGRMAEAFNRFVERIHGIMAQVAEHARELAGAVGQLAASAEVMSNGFSRQAGETQMISAAIEEMNQTTSEVAGKSADAAQQAVAAGSRAGEGLELVAGTVTGIRNMAEIVRSATQSIQELGERSDQIGRIVNVINEIADQTNLLALNAAIEAARAGEHGRGFAVVADEVRKLADRTSGATREVAEAIRGIQHDTAEISRRMAEESRRVDGNVTQAGESGEALRGIVANTDAVTTLIQAIAAASEQQATAHGQIALNLESMQQLSGQNADAVRESAEAAALLSRKGAALQGIVEQFKI